MKKLTLHLDELRVESFHAEPAAPRDGGTVKAHEDVSDATLCNASCAYDECPYGTGWAAYTCSVGGSCQGDCFSDNDCHNSRDC